MEHRLEGRQEGGGGEEELKNGLGQIGEDGICQADERTLFHRDEEPSKVFVQLVAQISAPPHYLPPNPWLVSLIALITLRSIYSFVCFVVVSHLTPQLGYEPHEDRDPTGRIHCCMPSSGSKWDLSKYLVNQICV